MEDKPHQMGEPVEPRQWFVSIEGYPLVQVKAETQDHALSVAAHHLCVGHYPLRAQTFPVRTRHKPLKDVLT